MFSQHSPTLLWVHNDFRLGDNPALTAAIEAGGPVIPVFIHNPQTLGNWPPGAASRWWLHAALEHFGQIWRKRGGQLILRQGESLEILNNLIKETGARRVYWNRRYEPAASIADERVRQELGRKGIGVATFNASLLLEPRSVKTDAGSPYQVFTPFWKSVSQRSFSAPCEPDIDALCLPSKFPQSDSLDSFSLLPRTGWHVKLSRHWAPTEDAAWQQMNSFLRDGMHAYAENRDRPDLDGTSRLSPYLHWGHISPRQVLAAIRRLPDVDTRGPSTYIKELYWREFAYHILHHFPHTPDEPLRPQFAHFPWEPATEALQRWKQGETGYPIVDAGMRQLWETGWMHNRVRMIAASILVKHLLVHWREGARWFWETLVDADLANNTLGWQWSGGCGADAAPYFRIFNPVLQALKFDLDGHYVRAWVPELTSLPTRYLHAPWEAPESLLDTAGVRLGKNYPNPIIDHKKGRERALAAYAAFRGKRG